MIFLTENLEFFSDSQHLTASKTRGTKMTGEDNFSAVFQQCIVVMVNLTSQISQYIENIADRLVDRVVPLTSLLVQYIYLA